MRTAILVLLITISGWITASAQSTHVVRAGETLFSISREFDVTVQQLREWNNLTNDNTISVGQKLIVGTDDDIPGEETSPGGQIADTVTHTVEPGQTLFRISRMYDVSVDDIKLWNRLEDNTISIGQELTLHIGTKSSERPRSPGIVTETPDDTSVTQDQSRITTESDENGESDYQVSEGPFLYEVQPGDALYKIAARFNMSVDEIMEMNRLEDSQLQVGQELRIRSQSVAPPSIAAEWDMGSTPQGKFVRYTVGEEDTLHQLLRFHQMDQTDFRELNPGISPSDIRPGDEVTLLLAPTSSQENPYRVRTTNHGTHQIQVSRYSDDQRGKTTTSGDLYNPSALTAAHPNLALGSVVYVENPETGHGSYVLVNDRTSENQLLLSDAAFRALRFGDSSSLIAKIDEQSD